MHRKNKLFSTFTLLLLVALALTTTVCANAPEPPDYLTVILSERHEEAVYADLLIKIDPSDSNYTDFSPGIYADHVYSSSEIVAYDDDGYRSFTFHYKNARSDIEINRYYDKMYYVDFCRGYDYNEFFTQYETLLNEYRDVKVALLDDEFNILVVSDAIRLPKVDKLLEFNGQVTYDIRENSLDFDLWINPYFLIFGGIISALMILISIGTEIIVALFFGLKSRKKTIFKVNLFSQIIMRVLYFVLPLTYLTETIILEILVYSVEFLIYKRLFPEEDTKKLLLYTVIANTLSLFLGIFLDCYILA